MLKFIHTGDVHLDTSFHSSDPELRALLRESLKEAFENVIEACIEEEVNALLIAGDLFDNDKLSFQTEQYLIKAFNRLREANIKVFYATGNHDPGDKSYRANMIKWPDNVYLYKDDRVQEYELTNSEGATIAKIVGVGHQSKKEARNLVAQFPRSNEEVPHIGLVHAMVTNASGVEKHDRYLPCSKEDLEDKNYTYWALGHIHVWQQVSQKQRIYYSGNLQGRHPRETGEKGGLIVTIDDYNYVKVEFRSFSTIQWESIQIKDLSEITNYNDLKNNLIATIDTYLVNNNIKKRLILRLELEGPCFLKEELRDSENLLQLQEDLKYSLNLLAVELKVDKLLKPYNTEFLKDGRHVLSKVLANIDRLKATEGLEDFEINRLISKGIRSQEAKEQYFKRLLEGLEVEAIGRMVGDK